MHDESKVAIGYRYKIYPTDEQKQLIQSYIDGYRYVYNWAIALETRAYEVYRASGEGKRFYYFYDLCKEYAKHRDEPDNEWLQKFPNTTARLALQDAIDAFKMFFRGYNRYPKFKTKKRSPRSFKTRNDRFYIDGNKMRFEGLPKIGIGMNSKVDMIELKFDTGMKRLDNIKYMRPVISIDNLDQYWVTFSIDKDPTPLPTPKTEPIGIDVGIRKTLTLSTGESFTRPNEKIKKLERRLSRLEHHRSRDINRRRVEAKRTRTKYDEIPVSKRAHKRELRIRKTYAKITHIKEYFYHTTIKDIVMRNPEAIVIEIIDSKELRKKKRNKRFRHDVAHADFFKMHHIIQDKCNKYSIPLIRADREYPSTQLCSNCGHRQEMHNKHIYKCPVCGMRMDRDVNAALNLVKLAV